MNSGACTLERAFARSKPIRSDTSRSARQKVRGDAPRRLRESTRDRASGIAVPVEHADCRAVPLSQRHRDATVAALRVARRWQAPLFPRSPDDVKLGMIELSPARPWPDRAGFANTSEVRSVGKECVSMGISRVSQ